MGPRLLLAPDNTLKSSVVVVLPQLVLHTLPHAQETFGKVWRHSGL